MDTNLPRTASNMPAIRVKTRDDAAAIRDGAICLLPYAAMKSLVDAHDHDDARLHRPAPLPPTKA